MTRDSNFIVDNFLSSSKLRDYSPPYSVANEGFFHRVKAAGVVKLATDFYLVPKVRKSVDVPSLPTCLHVVIRHSFFKT